MKIVYKAASGEGIDFSEGLIRAVSISGICPEKSVGIEENGISGGTVTSECRKVRRIKLKAAICGSFECARDRLASVLGLSGCGQLEIRGTDGVKSIGCYSESVSADIEDGTNYAEIVFLCPNPFFENTGGADVYVQLCGSSGKWEFDDWELSEENETELSGILSGNSAFVPNNGGFSAGCIITAQVISDVSEIRAVNAQTKEFVGVRGSFSVGDIVIFRCIDGEKGIFLSSINDNSKLEDITHRIIWGSEFFKIAPGGARVYIKTDTGGMKITAHIGLKEYSEGF
ncbi:MAG: hypothetical protein ACI4SF_03065 [Oscillospiraceae bacterium]